MKLNKKILLTLLTAPAVASLLAGCSANKEKITIWVSETEGVADSFKELANKWASENGVSYDFEVVGVTEAESATQMLNDVSAGADIYCFAQDQFARLVQGGPSPNSAPPLRASSTRTTPPTASPRSSPAAITTPIL